MNHDFILLDRSGSMVSQWTEALSAVNSYVKGLAEQNVDTGVTLAVFDKNAGQSTFDVIRDRITPATWKSVSADEVSPRGYTPLNDATGKLVALARAGFNGVQYDRVAIIIMTDGEENASTEFTVPQIKALLDDCRAKGWQVIFLGANFDNARQAASYGNAMGQTASASSANLRSSGVMMSQKRGLYGATGQSMGFTDDEKEALKQDTPLDNQP